MTKRAKPKIKPRIMWALVNGKGKIGHIAYAKGEDAEMACARYAPIGTTACRVLVTEPPKRRKK